MWCEFNFWGSHNNNYWHGRRPPGTALEFTPILVIAKPSSLSSSKFIFDTHTALFLYLMQIPHKYKPTVDFRREGIISRSARTSESTFDSRPLVHLSRAKNPYHLYYSLINHCRTTANHKFSESWWHTLSTDPQGWHVLCPLGDKDKNKDKHEDKHKVLKRPNTCYIFEKVGGSRVSNMTIWASTRPDQTRPAHHNIECSWRSQKNRLLQM